MGGFKILFRVVQCGFFCIFLNQNSFCKVACTLMCLLSKSGTYGHVALQVGGALNHGTINDRFLKTFYIETELNKKVKLSE